MNPTAEITVIIEGGTVQDICFANLKEPVKVVIKDYDIEDSMLPDFMYDRQGYPYCRMVFNSGDYVLKGERTCQR